MLPFNIFANRDVDKETTPDMKPIGSAINSNVIGNVTVNAELRSLKQNVSCNGTVIPFGVRGFPRPGVTQQRIYANPDLGDYSRVDPTMVQGILYETVYRRDNNVNS